MKLFFNDNICYIYILRTYTLALSHNSDNCRSRQWAINSHREDLLGKDVIYRYQNCKLCAKHFSDSCFRGTLKNRLSETAIPTLFLKHSNVKRKLFDNSSGMYHGTLIIKYNRLALKL